MTLPAGPHCVLVTVATAVLLSGCGGGGSSGGGSDGGGSVPTNLPPTISTTTFEINEDSSLATQLSATDPEGLTVTFAQVSNPSNGRLTLSGTGELAYSPNANFNGTDQFSIRLTDASGGTAAVPISITVRPVNDAPVAQDDELRINAGPSSVLLTTNDTDADGDPLTVTILSQPRGGALTVSNGSAVTFTPENAYAGPASFRYRITDAAGATSEANARMVVGDFAGVVFASDETTRGTRELHLYDGFRTIRVSAPLPDGASVDQFSIAADARHVAYVVKAANDEVFLADLQQPGVARSIYRSPGASSFESTRVQLNRNGSYALIRDWTLASALRMVLVRASDGTATVLGSSNPEITAAGLYSAFNPVTDEFYVQAEVDSTPPQAGSGFTTLYAASTNAADPLQQIGASYVSGRGNGSGILPAVTSDGERVLHLSVTYGFPVANVTPNLLANHRPTQAETNVFRPLLPYEFAFPLAFDPSKDGKRVCYVLTDRPSSRSRVWFSDLTTPAHGVALTPTTDYNFDCKWANDDRTLVYSSSDAGGASELWSVDTLQPTARRVREPFVPGEQLYFSAVAGKSRIVLLGVSPPNSVMPDFYRASLDLPGTSTKFATASFIVSGNESRPKANETGTLIAYGRGDTTAPNPALPRLRLMSTQTTDYDWLVSRQDGTVGTGQFEFLPAR